VCVCVCVCVCERESVCVYVTVCNTFGDDAVTLCAQYMAMSEL
jgi:hypothetical protein